MRTFTKTGWTDVDHEDVHRMREAAEWWRTDAASDYPDDDDLDDLADRCDRVADCVKAALDAGDVKQANREAAHWPAEAGPWSSPA